MNLKNNTEENVVPEDVLYIYLHQPFEPHGYKKWATDFTWYKDTYKLDRVVKKP